MSDIQTGGRLAQVIATRGGIAPPEAPLVIEHREALYYMLCEAAELDALGIQLTDTPEGPVWHLR